MIGCFNVGTSYKEGWGIRQDSEKAKEFYGKSCDGGFDAGCEYYAKENKKN